MRGWTPEAFARAKPEFMEAVRFGLYAERAAPILARWRAIQGAQLDMTNPDTALIADKVRAVTVVPLIEAVLYPEDEADGE